MREPVKLNFIFCIKILSTRRFELGEFLHAGKMINQKPFSHFFGTFLLFDHMALGAFCNYVDPEAQPELKTESVDRIFSHTGKVHLDRPIEDKNGSLQS